MQRYHYKIVASLKHLPQLMRVHINQFTIDKTFSFFTALGNKQGFIMGRKVVSKLL